MSLSSLLQARSEAVGTKKSTTPAASPLPDIDSKDRSNPLAASEYASSIYNYYRRVEPKFKVATEYMTAQVFIVYFSKPICQRQRHTPIPVRKHVQVEINEKMRSILLDWLVEVHLKFKV